MESSNHEEEIRILKETNNELVQKLQHFKMKATQCENDKLYLMKENNDLRLKLTRLQSAEAAQARALDSALQTASEEALSHLVQASTAIARTIDLAKSYMRDRQNLEISSVRWSTIGGTPAPVREKVHKVAPLMMDGRSIQPFVSLDRMPLNNHITAPTVNQTQNVTERVLPLPMHILQDVYIPLRRIDASDFLNHSAGPVQNEDEEPSMEEAEEQEEIGRRESERLSEAREYDDSPLNVINEESELEDDNANASTRSLENPLEGPSWLLDMPRGRPRDKVKFEPDSTTEVDESTSNIDALRLPANQLSSQSPILEPRRHRSPESGRLETRAVAGCSQMRNDRLQGSSSSTPPPETRRSSSRYSTPKSQVTVRRRSPHCGRPIKESPAFGDRSLDLRSRSRAELSSGTPGQLDVGVESELTPSPRQLAFTPTVRRKRTSPLAGNTPSPPTTLRNSRARRGRKSSRGASSNKILKVIVPKIDINSLENSNPGDSRLFANTSTASEANRSDQQTSNTDTRLKRLEIKLSRSQFNVNRNTMSNNESVASTSRISENVANTSANETNLSANGSNMSANGANMSANVANTGANGANMSANEANTSANEANTSATSPNLSEIAGTSGLGNDQDGQGDRKKQKGKGRSKGGRKGKACGGGGSGDASPPKRRAICKSPSPNGSTDSTMEQDSERRRPSTNLSVCSTASDTEGASGGLRTRRARALVTYKEKPLNVKLRRI